VSDIIHNVMCREWKREAEREREEKEKYKVSEMQNVEKYSNLRLDLHFFPPSVNPLESFSFLLEFCEISIGLQIFFQNTI
jgi:hypothetical protein